MNKRIQELMNQTGVPTSIPFDQWCEKFAELIVKECINITNDQYFAYEAVEALQKNFGVEE
jgi:predicted HicB family RNase H-like nuclease